MAKKTSAEPTSPMTDKKAPAFTLPDQEGNKHKLSDYKGKYVVLYWYPKDNTPGCTKESCGFRDLKAEFDKLDVTVFSASILDSKSKAKFAEKHSLNYPLLADEDHAIAEKYGLWIEKKNYGKTYWGINRETFIIDPDGKIAAHWPKAKGNEAHSEEVLEWIKENA